MTNPNQPGDWLPEAFLLLTNPAGEKQFVRLEHPTTVVGRDPRSDLVIDDARVSRRHAELTWNGDAFTIVDLDSKNGTKINGELVTRPVSLSDADRIEFGGREAEFVLSNTTATIVTPLANITPGATSALSVNMETHEVRVEGKQVELTPKEFMLLALLYQKAGAVVTREEIASSVWPELEGSIADESIVQVVARLRRKIEPDANEPRYLMTIRGFGYRLVL